MDASLFVGNEVHKRSVKLADGTEHELFFREVPATVFRRYYREEQSTDDEVFGGSMARLIAASMCEADGKPALTYEQALQLKVGVMTAIFSAVLDVNGFNAAKNA